VAGVVVAIVVVMVVSASGLDEPEPGPLGEMDILVTLSVADGVVRVVTEEAGCRYPVFADTRLHGDVIELRVLGQSAGGGCAADIKFECHEVRLPEQAVGKRLVAVPVAEGAQDVGGKSLAPQYVGAVFRSLDLQPATPVGRHSAVRSLDVGGELLPIHP
jgi:hypothetical protein